MVLLPSGSEYLNIVARSVLVFIVSSYNSNNKCYFKDNSRNIINKYILHHVDFNKPVENLLKEYKTNAAKGDEI